MNKSGKLRWYALSSRPSPGGKFTRYYEVTCRQCGKKEPFHANNLMDEGLRKIFIRKGWLIGKTLGQHLCPVCQVPAEQSKPSAPIPLYLPSELYQRLNAYCAQRGLKLVDGLSCLLEQPEPVLVPEPVVVVPPEPVPAQVNGAVAELIPPHIAENEAADWWQDLMQKD